MVGGPETSSRIPAELQSVEDLPREWLQSIVRKIWDVLPVQQQERVWDQLTDEEAAELVLALPPLPKEIVDKLAAKADETVRRGKV